MPTKDDTRPLNNARMLALLQLAKDAATWDLDTFKSLTYVYDFYATTRREPTLVEVFSVMRSILRILADQQGVAKANSALRRTMSYYGAEPYHD